MKVQQIHQLFRRLGEQQIRFRWASIILALLFTAIGIAGLSRVQTANSRDSWFDDAEAIKVATRRFEAEFGNNDTIAVLVEAKDVFDPRVLRAIKELGDELRRKVPYADHLTSLVELEVVMGTKEGMKIKNPFKHGIPDDPKQLEAIRRQILSRRAFKDKLVSSDCKETWLTLSLVEFPPEEEWKKKTNLDPLFQAGEAAIAVVTQEKFKSDLYTFKAAGMPYSETEERDFFGSETKKRVLSGFIAMVLLLVFFLRSLRGVLVPVFTTFIGIVVVFGAMGWLGIAIDANMMTLPVLLGMALSVGYSIHVFNAFKRRFDETGRRKESAIAAIEETGWPIFFTAITTIGSLLSFISTGILTIEWLGYTCAAVVFADFLFVMALVPVLMSFGKDKQPIAMGDSSRPKLTFTGPMRALSRFAIGRRKAIVLAFALLIAALAPGLRYVKVNMDTFAFMGLKIPYVKRLWEVCNSQLGSYLSYNITLDSGKKDGIKDPKVLRAFDKLMQKVGAFEMTKKNRRASAVHSILDILKQMNQTLHEEDPAYYRVPESKQYVAQLLLLYEMSGGTEAFRWIDERYSILRGQVQLNRFDAKKVALELAEIKAFGKKHVPGAKVSVVGDAVQFAELNEKIVTGELKSVFIALLVITLLLILVFGSLKTGLIGLIPNATPLLVIGGYMGYLNSQLDMMTMTIMPMLLGIAVDDTIHFINQMKYEFERCANYRAAVESAFLSVGRNLAMTTIVLSVTFLMYAFSPVSNLVRIGYLAALGLTVALATDYLMTPALVLLTKPFGPERVEGGPRDDGDAAS